MSKKKQGKPDPREKQKPLPKPPPSKKPVGKPGKGPPGRGPGPRTDPGKRSGRHK